MQRTSKGASQHHEESWQKRWLKRFVGAAAVASVVALTQGLWEPLEELAMIRLSPLITVLYQLQDQSRAPRGVERIAVVKLDEASYVRRYGGHEPLNRCEMKEDLTRLAAIPGIHTIAVDFDLSPILAPSKVQEDCQNDLNALLSDRRNLSRWILMRPAIPEGPPAYKEAVEHWEIGMRKAGMAFADVSIFTNRGWVIGYPPQYGETPTMGLSIDERMLGRSREAQLAAAASKSAAHNNSDGTQGSGGDAMEVNGISFLAITKLFHNGMALPFNAPCLQENDRPPECAQVTTLLFGSGYTPLDRYQTAFGELDGVDLHAAIAACPRLRPAFGHFASFLLEILFGAVVLAPTFDYAWRRYFRTVSGEAMREARQNTRTTRRSKAATRWLAKLVPTRPEAAYLWIVFIVFLAMGILALFIATTVALFLRQDCALIEGVMPMAIGMFIEVSIMHSLEVSSELMSTAHQHREHSHSHSATGLSAWRTWFPHRALRWLMLGALIFAAVIHHLHWPWM